MKQDDGDIELELVIDGKAVPTNYMVNKILTNTIDGAAGTLRGVNSEWKELELNIKR